MRFFIAAIFSLALASLAKAETNGNILARIALLSDTHTVTVTNIKQASYAAHFHEAATAANTMKVDLVLIAGDLTDRGKLEEMDEFQKQVRQFTAPVWFVPGNHDVGNKLNAGRPPVVTAETVAAYEEKLGPSFFERTRAGVRVIGINSSLFGSGLPRETEMWNFLETKLAKTNRLPTLLLSHYPPFLKSADEPGGDYYNIEPEARRHLLGLLRKGGVTAMLSGHYHRPLVNRLKELLLVTTPPISFGLPAGKQDPGWTLITVHASGEVHHEFQSLKN